LSSFGEEDISEIRRDVCGAEVSRTFKRIYDEEVNNWRNRLKLGDLHNKRLPLGGGFFFFFPFADRFHVLTPVHIVELAANYGSIIFLHDIPDRSDSHLYSLE
jgi:hypothetical protein